VKLNCWVLPLVVLTGYPAIQMAMDRNHVSGLLKTLSPLQEKVIRLYFGLGCQRSHSASEIAREFHVSSQVISGIIGGAVRRLAHEGLTPSKLREAASFEAEISLAPKGE
jgi:DNA-directed RNA polymerase sigma subunit (sigma70/sigma32)